jgi:hypothetical protein
MTEVPVLSLYTGEGRSPNVQDGKNARCVTSHSNAEFELKGTLSLTLSVMQI